MKVSTATGWELPDVGAGEGPWEQTQDRETPRGDSGTIGPKPHQQWPRGHLDPALPMPASPHTAVEVESRCGIQEDFQLTVLLFPPPSLLKLQT